MTEVMVHTWEESKGVTNGGSPWYVPRSEESLKIPGPISMKDGNSSCAPMRGRMLSKFFLDMVRSVSTGQP
jgi:hypothetical protein